MKFHDSQSGGSRPVSCGRRNRKKDTMKLELVVCKCFAEARNKYVKLSRNFRHYAPHNFFNVVLRTRAQSSYALRSKYIHTHGVESGKRAGHKGHALLKTATELRLHLNCRRCDKPIVPLEVRRFLSHWKLTAFQRHLVYISSIIRRPVTVTEYLSDRSSNPVCKVS